MDSAYVYLEEKEKFEIVTANEMAKLKKDAEKQALFLRYKENSYWSDSFEQKMVFVNASPPYFRRHAGPKNDFIYRGDAESKTHHLFKDVISRLHSFQIEINKKTYDLCIEKAEIEKPVICFGRHYKCDLYFKLSAKTSKSFLDEYGNEVYFELCHTCPVDKKQSDDFEIEGLTLLEYHIPDKYTIYPNITIEGYNKQLDNKTGIILKNGLKDVSVYSKVRFKFATWYKGNSDNTIKTVINNIRFTIIKLYGYSNKKYRIRYSINGIPQVKDEFNGKAIRSLTEAKNLAEAIANRILLGKSIE